MRLTDYRRNLGLTAKQVQMFELLLKEGPKTANQVASLIGCLPNAVYRLAKTLEEKQYVIINREQPRHFQAVALPIALELYQQNSAQQHQTMLHDLINSNQINYIDNSTIIQIVTGRQALYKLYVDEAEEAKIEILVFAIGIAYSAELEDAQRQALARHVEIRHIVQKKDPDNYYVIQKWLRLGVKMRYYATPIGFHLMIFDANTVILSLSNPSDTEERTSLVFKSPTAAGTLRDYFYGLWAASKLIN